MGVFSKRNLIWLLCIFCVLLFMFEFTEKAYQKGVRDGVSIGYNFATQAGRHQNIADGVFGNLLGNLVVFGGLILLSISLIQYFDSLSKSQRAVSKEVGSLEADITFLQRLLDSVRNFWD